MGAFARKGLTWLVLALFSHSAQAFLCIDLLKARPPFYGWSTEQKNVALFYAASEGNRQQVKALLKAGAEVNYQCSQGRTALMQAAAYLYPSIVRVLLNKKADVHIQNNKGQTALMQGAYQHPRIALALIEAGARIDHRSHDGSTALTLAIRAGNARLVQALLQAGAQLDPRLPDGNTPLTAAVGSGDIKLVRYFLQAGVQVDATSSKGNTALMHAVLACHIEIVKLLLTYGANPYLQNSKGHSAISMARQHKYKLKEGITISSGRHEAYNNIIVGILKTTLPR